MRDLLHDTGLRFVVVATWELQVLLHDVQSLFGVSSHLSASVYSMQSSIHALTIGQSPMLVAWWSSQTSSVAPSSCNLVISAGHPTATPNVAAVTTRRAKTNHECSAEVICGKIHHATHDKIHHHGHTTQREQEEGND